MGLSRTVASLAIDPFRQLIWKARACFPVIGLRRDLWISIVTGHTPVSDLAAETGMVRPVKSRTHRPVSAILYIPGDGKLHQFPGFRSPDVTPCMFSGPEPVIDLCLKDIGDCPVETNLVPLKNRLAIS